MKKQLLLKNNLMAKQWSFLEWQDFRRKYEKFGWIFSLKPINTELVMGTVRNK